VGSYGPLKTSYSQACDDFLVSNPGICISIKHIPKIFGTAYLKVATIQTAVNAFRETGFEPYDSNIFRDEDFQLSLTTDIQSVESTAPAFELQPEILFENTNSAISPTANDSFENQHPQLQTELTPSTSSALPTLPVASKKTARKPRKKLPSFLLSGTPVKEALEQKRKEQEEKELKRQKRLTEKSKKKKPRRQLDFPSSSDDEPSIPVPCCTTLMMIWTRRKKKINCASYVLKKTRTNCGTSAISALSGLILSVLDVIRYSPAIGRINATSALNPYT